MGQILRGRSKEPKISHPIIQLPLSNDTAFLTYLLCPITRDLSGFQDFIGSCCGNHFKPLFPAARGSCHASKSWRVVYISVSDNTTPVIRDRTRTSSGLGVPIPSFSIRRDILNFRFWFPGSFGSFVEVKRLLMWQDLHCMAGKYIVCYQEDVKLGCGGVTLGHRLMHVLILSLRYSKSTFYGLDFIVGDHSDDLHSGKIAFGSLEDIVLCS